MTSSVVILAGGASRRMGRDKLTLRINKLTLLESAVNRFTNAFNNVYLSVDDPDKYPEIALRKIVDLKPGAGPISGLHASLISLQSDGIFLVAADLPYACPHAAMRIIQLCGDNDACVIRLPGGNVEPLFGFYRKTVLPLCNEALASGDNRMSELLLKADTRYVAPQDLSDAWDDKILMNINDPADYERMISKGSKS